MSEEQEDDMAAKKDKFLHVAREFHVSWLHHRKVGISNKITQLHLI